MKALCLFIRRSFSAVGLFAILFAACLNSSRAQDTWTQKADFGGTGRTGAVGFSIGGKGYIGTGYDNINYRKDFWEYDSTSNSWSQKADFGGVARGYACAFSLNSKGYIGTGFGGLSSNDSKKDFWEYDPVTNTWTQKADFAGKARYAAVGFSIGGKGYIGTGDTSLGSGYVNDFWEYDPSTNGWTQKANFAGTARGFAVGLSIGNKGYIGTGNDYFNIYKNDFWEYDPSTNAWTQKADFGGSERSGAVGFSMGSKGYIGTGFFYDGSSHYENDFWEYDPGTNSWSEKANFGGTARLYAVGFSVGSKAYISTGIDLNSSYKKDFWEYTPASLSCAVPTNLSVTNITTTSAKLNWNAVAGAEGYTVRYKVSNTSGWTDRTTNSTSKAIGGLLPNTIYKWEIKTFCQIAPNVASDWSSKQTFTTGALRTGDESVQQVSFQIYPNPAEDHATVQFTLPQSSHVYVKVYDVSGKEIETLLDAELEHGEHSLPINTQHFSKGVYVVRLISDLGIQNHKLIVQ